MAQSDALMMLSDLCNWSLANEPSSSADGGVTKGGGEGVESEAKLLESKVRVIEGAGSGDARTLLNDIII